MAFEISRDVIERLGRHGQQHVQRWWEELCDDDRGVLAAQIDTIDFELIERSLAEARSRVGTAGEAAAVRARRAEPPRDLVRLGKSAERQMERIAAGRVGHDLLRSGRVGALVVAGGQGTRLGFPHPKGKFPIGPVSGATLFQVLAEQVLARSRQAGRRIPYFVMTSQTTHDETLAFFSENNYFGLDSGEVFFFQQGSLPVIDDGGRLLLEQKGRLCVSPDGHGGVLNALARAGLLEEMRSRGIDYLYYHQVDNPTAIVCDPVFLGFHKQRHSEMSTKVVAKRSAEERIGVVVEVDGRTQIIEYSDLPAVTAARTDADGNLVLWAGSTAMHVFNRTFLERLVGDDLALPVHLAQKAVPFLDEAGRPVTPEKPNAYKLERFIFDALPHAERALVVEADRRREFNPVKNATGEDSPDTAKSALTAIARQWLETAGANVREGVAVEISPLFALDADELRHKLQPGTVLNEAVYLAPN